MNQEMVMNYWPYNQKNLTLQILTEYELKYFSAIKDQEKETVAVITVLPAHLGEQEKLARNQGSSSLNVF